MRWTTWNRPLLGLGAVMAALAVVTLAGVALDDRIVTGAPVWLKPAKFSISFVLYAGTLAWMLSLLPRRSRGLERAVVVVVAASVAEMAIIVLQAARGTTSHFNATTPLDGALFQVMGVSVLVLFGAQVVVSVAVLRERIGDRVAAAGVGLGLVLFLLGLLVAVPMLLPTNAPLIAQGIAGAHSVGVPDGGPGLPVLGWSTTGGDLRVAHFVGMHALQVLPLLALLLGRYAPRLGERVTVRLLVVAGTAYGTLTLLLMWQALRGQPVVAPDAWTLTALGLTVLGAAGAVAAILTRRAVPAVVPSLHPERPGHHLAETQPTRR